MLAVFSSMFVAVTKIIFGYNFLAFLKSKIMIVSAIALFNVSNTHLFHRPSKGEQT